MAIFECRVKLERSEVELVVEGLKLLREQSTEQEETDEATEMIEFFELELRPR